MSDLYVPNSVNLRNFDTLFKDNDFRFRSDVVHVRFHPTMVALHPVAIAFYAALGFQLKKSKIRVEGQIGPKIHTVPFLQRMGLFEALGLPNPIEFVEHDETGRFIPVMTIWSSSDLQEFLRTVDPILHTTRDNSRVIKHVFGELLRNVVEHAEAPGFVCATYNRRRRKVSIGIADPGLGIRRTMLRHHGTKTHKDALYQALTPGISGKTKKLGGTADNAGAGLFFTKSIAQSTKNHFVIYSGDAYFKLLLPRGNGTLFAADPRFDRATVRDGLPYFDGTLVGIDLHTEDTKAFNRLIERIGDAYQLAVRKSKKDYSGRIRFT